MTKETKLAKQSIIDKYNTLKIEINKELSKTKYYILLDNKIIKTQVRIVTGLDMDTSIDLKTPISWTLTKVDGSFITKKGEGPRLTMLLQDLNLGSVSDILKTTKENFELSEELEPIQAKLTSIHKKAIQAQLKELKQEKSRLKWGK